MTLTKETLDELKSWFEENYDGYVNESEPGEDFVDVMTTDAISDLDLDDQSDEVKTDVSTYLRQKHQNKSGESQAAQAG